MSNRIRNLTIIHVVTSIILFGLILTVYIYNFSVIHSYSPAVVLVMLNPIRFTPLVSSIVFVIVF